MGQQVTTLKVKDIAEIARFAGLRVEMDGSEDLELRVQLVGDGENALDMRKPLRREG